MRPPESYRVRPGRPVRLAGLALLVLIAAGCGGKYKPVAVSGKVTLNGKALDAATVYFYAVGDAKEGRPAQGVTDKEGKYYLSTLRDGDGALPGEYKVVIQHYVPTIKIKIPDFPDTQEGKEQRDDFMYRNFEAKGIQPFKSSLPAKYGDTGSTPLSYKVTGRTRSADFELSSK